MFVCIYFNKFLLHISVLQIQNLTCVYLNECDLRKIYHNMYSSLLEKYFRWLSDTDKVSLLRQPHQRNSPLLIHFNFFAKFNIYISCQSKLVKYRILSIRHKLLCYCNVQLGSVSIRFLIWNVTIETVSQNVFFTITGK